MWRFAGRVCGVVAAILLVVAVPACAERRGRKHLDQIEIQQMEQKWRQAQLAEDIGTMDKLLSEEFMGVTASGQVVTKLQQLERMRTRRLDLRRLDIVESKIKISGNLAVVTSLAEIDGTADGAPLRGAFRYTRVYQRLPGEGWKITNFEATHVGRLSRVSREEAPQASWPGPPGAAPNSLPASQAGSGSPRPPS